MDSCEAIRLAHEAPIRLGPLMVEPPMRRVVADDGREEILQPRIMQVLVALAQAEGRILTRDDLTARCWDGVVVGEDAINRAIGHLRRLSEGLGRGAFDVQTVHKVGYRLRLAPHAPAAAPTPAEQAARPTICVLPFVNMSDDIEQGWFSDGVSQDIITDLGKVSALSVVARNTAFSFKGAAADVRQIAAQVGASHVVEGSVRKSAGRVRITAQIVEATGGLHVWSERWDRDLSDIFALQDEISQAIVAELKCTLLPDEKCAIERRGTTSLDAFNLYLQARQQYVSCNYGDAARVEAITRLCRRATDIDPDYAQAWAMMAQAQAWLFNLHTGDGDDGQAAADRALSLDPNMPDALAAKAKAIALHGDPDGAAALLKRAFEIDPNAAEVHDAAAAIHFRAGRLAQAIPHFEAAASLMESDYAAPGMLISCHVALGDAAAARRAALATRQRAEAVLASDPGSGGALGFLVTSLAVLGERNTALDWIERALKLDPDNQNMRYNFACALATLGETDAALDHLGSVLASVSAGFVDHAASDPDLNPLRSDPRLAAILADARRRLQA